jgi:hypothetical protein
MQGKARDILILLRITDFSTTSSAGLKRRNNGRKYVVFDLSYKKVNMVTWFVMETYIFIPVSAYDVITFNYIIQKKTNRALWTVVD